MAPDTHGVMLAQRPDTAPTTCPQPEQGRWALGGFSDLAPDGVSSGFCPMVTSCPGRPLHALTISGSLKPLSGGLQLIIRMFLERTELFLLLDLETASSSQEEVKRCIESQPSPLTACKMLCTFPFLWSLDKCLIHSTHRTPARTSL